MGLDILYNVYWLDERDLVACTGHSPLPGVAVTRRPEQITCGLCEKRIHGTDRHREVRSPSPDAQAFIDSMLGAYSAGMAAHIASARMRRT